MRAMLVLLSAAGLLIALSAACSSKLEYRTRDAGPDDDAGVVADTPDAPDLVGDAEGAGEAGCRGLECKRVACPGGDTTTLSGTVFAPNGTLPLYNVIVYIPNDPLKDIPEGVQCDRCGAIASGNPINVTLSDSTGHFELTDVPVGEEIPLVVQLGKWRRQTSVTIEKCTNNVITDPELTRLPKNTTEGNMPKIAVTTGGCDKLACMLPKTGIDSAEFGVPGDDKAVTFFLGGGGGGPTGSPPASTLWSNLEELKKYDVAIFSCECSESTNTKDATSYQAVYDYLAAGGRIFTTDFQYLWYRSSPDPSLQGSAVIPGNANTGGTPFQIDTSFPKGQALADWLQFIDPTLTYSQLKPEYPFYNFDSVDPTAWQVWARSGPSSSPFGEPQYPRFMSVNIPVDVEEDQKCGKALHLDAHISSDSVDNTFPAGCKTALNTGEAAFAFMFFDLSSCIQKEDAPPVIPH